MGNLLTADLTIIFSCFSLLSITSILWAVVPVINHYAEVIPVPHIKPGSAGAAGILTLITLIIIAVAPQDLGFGQT